MHHMLKLVFRLYHIDVMFNKKKKSIILLNMMSYVVCLIIITIHLYFVDIISCHIDDDTAL